MPIPGRHGMLCVSRMAGRCEQEKADERISAMQRLVRIKVLVLLGLALAMLIGAAPHAADAATMKVKTGWYKASAKCSNDDGENVCSVHEGSSYKLLYAEGR